MAEWYLTKLFLTPTIISTAAIIVGGWKLDGPPVGELSGLL
jgi:hypothetical protein